MNDNTHILVLQDTAGEEKYASLSSFYCRGASVAIFAFDLTDRRSLEKLQEVFIPLLEDSVDRCLPVVVGTKLDLVPERGRQVKTSEGQELAETELHTLLERALKINPNSYLKTVQGKKLYFETSAKSGEGVTELFEHIQSVILPQLEKTNSGARQGRTASKRGKAQERSIRLDAGDGLQQSLPTNKCCGSN